ncbi:hypothetical protein DSCA_19950 [Desulfosarcina alkanivorans]|uniref:Secreted protein n=1 Tax=Desulfosarcina alkanivorans TaxID=571177 RepID=A0A5K7YI60_9BACT|nr:hypothetical protein [Desulfosarcina alkanivorans]BBO68065.1 hypothetical protein DSCA_19950 [Desulfosarcina alkanivorans]
MRNTTVWGIIVIAVFFLLSSDALAGTLSFSWGGSQQTGTAPTVAKANKNGPPAHAPAYGYRSKHQYHYYPSASVYHDTSRGLYFYLSGSGWQIAASLPQDLKVRLGNSVSIEMETDKPYLYNDQHKKQYPPEKIEKGKTKKEKKRAKS